MYSEEEAQPHAQRMTGEDQRREALLKEQVLIEQLIVLETGERQNYRQQAQLAAEVPGKYEQKQKQLQQQLLVARADASGRRQLDLIRERQRKKWEAIERRLDLIRERLKKQRKADNSEGIAALRAAVAAS